MGLIKDELEELGFKVTGKSCKDTSIRNVLKRFKENYEGANIKVDSQLSSTSENPVQNKVIKQALDGKATYDGFKTFLNSSLQKGEETDLSLPSSYLNFGTSNRTTIDSEFWDYLYNKKPIGYTFTLNLYNTNLGDNTAVMHTKAIIIGETYTASKTIKILNIALEYNFDTSQTGLFYNLSLRLYKDVPNVVDVVEEQYTRLLQETQVDNIVIPSSTNPVSSEGVYAYVSAIYPNRVNKDVRTISDFQELLLNYSDDYMRGLGRIFYSKLEDTTPMVYECFLATSVVDGNLNPIIRYIDSSGIVQVIDPSSLTETNYISYNGYHYGTLPDEESSGDDSGGGSVE